MPYYAFATEPDEIATVPVYRLLNEATDKPYVLFDHPLANPDGINHFNRWGNGEFRVEDVLKGGDRDFNDLRIRLQFR